MTVPLRSTPVLLGSPSAGVHPAGEADNVVLHIRDMRCTVLGPISVDGVVPGAPLERRLLAALLVNRGSPVSADQLVDVLWFSPPPSATNALQSKVSRLRTLCGSERLRRIGNGYTLDVPAGGCDADRFDDLVCAAAALEPAAQVEQLDQALGLWVGNAFGEFAEEDFARPAAVGLEQRRLRAEEQRLTALAAIGRHDEIVGCTTDLIDADPYREAFWAARMRALAQSGRTVDAVRCYQQARERFLDDTGIAPSAALAALEQAILAGELEPQPSSEPRAAVAPASTTEPDPMLSLHTPQPASSTNRKLDADLSRVGLIDRERERAVIDQQIAAAIGGAPTVCVVAGDVGLGKSSLVEAAASSARAAHMRVIKGRAVPGMHSPLGPIGQAMTAVGLTRPVHESSSAEAGDHRFDLADGDPGAAVTSAVLALLDRLVEQPTLLVLEDVHHGGRTTSEALELLVAELESRAAADRVPLAVVVVHRPLDPTNPHHVPLQRIHRSSLSTCVELRPFDEAGVASVIEKATGLRPTARLTQRIATLTDGIPLLVATTIDVWSRAGHLEAQAGRADAAERAAPIAPADVEAGLLTKWNALDSTARRVTSVLALSPLVDLLPASDVTSVVADTLSLDVGSVLRALDEAVRVGLLGGIPHLRFLSPHTRSFVTAQVPRAERAEILGRLTVELTETARVGHDAPLARTQPALAVHTLLSAEVAGVRLASDDALVKWAIAAGDMSLAVGAWEAAVHHLAVASDRLGASAEDRRLEDGTLLELALGAASFLNHDEQDAQVRLLEVADRAAGADDPRTEGVALGLVHRIAMAYPAVDLPCEAATARERIADYANTRADVAPVLAARAHASLAEDAFTRDDAEDAERHVDRARRILRKHEVESVAEVDFAAGLAALGALQLRIAAHAFERSMRDSMAAGDQWVASWGAGRLVLAHHVAGDRGATSAALERALDLQLTSRLWSELTLTRALQASIAATDGETEAAIAFVEESERLAVRSGYTHARSIALPVLAYVLAGGGDVRGARAALERIRTDGRPPWPFAALVEVVAGDVDAAEALVASRLHRLPERPSLHQLPAIVATAAVAAASRNLSAARVVAPLLEDLRQRGVRRVPGWPDLLVDTVIDLDADVPIKPAIT